MNVALVHEFLITWGGSDFVVQKFAEIYPDAPIYTALYNRKKMEERFEGIDIRTSFLQRIPGGLRRHRYLMPFFPFAFESFDLTEYDLVLSSHHLAAKCVLTTPNTCHVCFCHTPMRYGWDFTHEYVGNMRSLLRLPMRIALHYLRTVDVASSNRVDYYIANSRYVANRIRKYYRREVEVINSPVDASKFHISDQVDDYWLVVSRMVGYKRVDLAVEVFNRLKKKLVVVGTGPELQRIKAMAGPTVEVVGFVPDEELPGYYARCKAFIFPGIEDFGITPLEAQASGRPVIAFRTGGALETVLDGKTGKFFDEQTPEALSDAVVAAEKMEFDPPAIRRHAERFDVEIFKIKIKKFIDEKLEEWKNSRGG